MSSTLILLILFSVAAIGAIAKFFPSLAIIAQFTYPNAKFNAIGAPYLKEKELAHLINSKSLEDLKNNIVSRDFHVEGESIEEMQKSIDASLIKILQMAKNDSPRSVKKFYDAYIKKIDARPLKNVLKAIAEEKEIPEEEIFSPEIKNFVEAIRKASKDEMPAIFSFHGMEEIWKLIEEKAPFMEIEGAIEKKIIREILAVPLPKSCRHARDLFVKYFIDILNLKAIFRAKYMGMELKEKNLFGEGREISHWQLEHFLKIDAIAEIISLLEGTSYIKPLRDALTEFEKEGVGALERALDRHFLSAVGNIAVEHTMNLGPGIRFVVEKEFEAQNLRAIIKGVGEEMPAERIWKVVVVEK
ncbi:MAG: hypothetical protein FE048_01920 [Thermoplasmata archaeon]|nr:MAG: hypothetical protein FE048_01920 [Thermoplasmata archaeon]